MTKPHDQADDAKKAGKGRAPGLVRDAQRMSVKILGWSLVLGFAFSFLFSLSSPEGMNFLVVLKRGLITGIALGAAIIVVALFLFPGFRRK